jgi:vacuolar-type H+-ATPase subunit F/Vma7
MKIACIGDRLSLLGIGLAGIKKVTYIKGNQDAREKLQEIANSKDYGLVLITSDVYKEIEETVKEIEGSKTLPIFLEIPFMKYLEGVKETE